MFDTDFFEISDGRASKHWIVFMGVENQCLAHGDVTFKKFDFVGITEFALNPRFYENYLNGATAEVEYVNRMAELLSNERKINKTDSTQFILVQSPMLLCPRCLTAFETNIEEQRIKCPSCGAAGQS
jgi:hypothetical protein